MTVLVEKYIEFPYVYASDDEALSYIAELMQLTDWQAVCDVIHQDSSGAVVNTPDGVAEMWFDDEMQVILFKVLKPLFDAELTYDDEGNPVITGGVNTQVRAVSFLPERGDDA